MRSLFSLISVLFCVSTAFAQDVVAPIVAGEGGAPAQENMSFTAQLVGMLPMFAMIFFIFYFLVARPQAKQLKEHNQMLSELKRGDEVVTSFGMLGRVAGIEKDYILLEIANGVKVRVLTSSVSRKAEKTGNA